ncbi:MAG: type II toxin-antitoxin system HicB family antitoxin [Desulfovibrio sp.]|jgi:predicted HicB family RNase H-like nuclease|nr:type II toxin-antitoxin system HicB family antitoxin [Desulfovibrio sp.]
MNNALIYKGYTGTVEYSEEDACLFGRIAGICDIISYEGESVAEIRKAFEESVDDYLEHCAVIGKQPNKPYSGKFVLRLDPSIHARLAVKAQAKGKSLNQFAAEVLAQALGERLYLATAVEQATVTAKHP